MTEQELTVESIETMQTMYLGNFIDDNEIRAGFNLWLEARQYEEKEGEEREILLQFIKEMDFKEAYQKWLVLIFREDNDDLVTPNEIHRFVRLFEVK